MTWYVYILECSDGSFYTGATNDVERRMKQHKEGKGSKYVYQKGFRKLLRAKHVEREDIRTRESVIDVAKAAGLDINKFTEVLDDPASLAQIGIDHEEALEHGVFGTPTFVFEDGTSAFLKMFTPPEDEAMSAFNDFMRIASKRSYFGELKRPQPPWPRGVRD
ncbi:MAG TPA: hypothetical protein EYQ61_05670 [Dehalococcoidia bacterium]|nr:hypothetical protein [Dehalococcoidia bacterium]